MRKKILSQDDSSLEAFLSAYLFQRQEALQAEAQVAGAASPLEPELSFVYREDDHWRLSALVIPTEWWIPDPAGGLVKISSVFARMAQDEPQLLALAEKLKPETWKGLAFVCEAWVVKQHHEGAGMDPVLEAMAENRMLSQHPARESAIIATVILSNGVACQAWLLRDGSNDGGTFTCPPGEPMLTGRVPEALSAIIAALGG
jgi:hypothetical protein